MRSNYKSVDEYIKTFPKETQNILKKVRSQIKKLVPNDAEETISYQIPTFKLNGKFVIYYAAFKNHFSLYPIPNIPDKFKKKIEPNIKGKGTISFPLKEPIPFDLIFEIVKYSLSDNLNRTKKK